MKKILVAAALAFVASSASALIANSRHDFQTNGYVSPIPTSACVFCHTPHNANPAATGAPIWARNLITPTVYYVGSTTAAINNISVSVGGVQTCLGCHANGTAAEMGTTSALAASATVGTDLSNDHPVGNDTLFGSTGLKVNPTLGGVTFANGAALTCAGCHDVHNSNAAAGTALLRSFSGDFCTVCHDK